MSSLNTVNTPVMVSRSPRKTQLNDETIFTFTLTARMGYSPERGALFALEVYDKVGTFPALVCKRCSLILSTKLFGNLDRKHNAKVWKLFAPFSD